MFALAITIIGDTNIGMHYFRHTAKALSLNITKTKFAHSWKYLFDFNTEITYTLCELLDLQPNICSTNEFIPINKNNDFIGEYADFREVIRPKHPLADKDFVPMPYYQVYEPKIGFQPNLSILDLLFNMGNESIFYL